MKISGKTRLVGILGYPVAHSLSPAMHNAAFESLGLDYCYVPFEVPPEGLTEAVRALAPLGIRGVNVTIPYKERVSPLLDRLSEDAQRIGAVNTVLIEPEGLIGHNTDGLGFLQALREEGGVDPAGQRVLILGAGGSARAVGIQLARSGIASLWIMNRTPARGQALAEAIRGQCPDLPIHLLPWEEASASRQPSLKEIDLIVNTTSVGMEGQPPAELIPDASLSSHLLVCDLVYRPRQTPLLKAASARGARTLSGLGMLLYQGALSFEIWTGRTAPVPVMRRALENALGEST